MLLIINKIFYVLGIITVLTLNSCATPAPEPVPPQPTPSTKPKMDCQVVVPELYGHYEGECQNGKAHGRGKAVGLDMYEGQFANGYPHGNGVYNWADEARFEGQFQKGIPQIPHTGCYVADPRLRGTYNGECRSGKASGRGKTRGIDAYEGEFIDGITNGTGTYVWHNGDRYLGKFQNGRPYGRGVVKYVDGYEEVCEDANDPSTCVAKN
ncbi:MORN repeat protein [Beggiatoa sp. PS]|nr:MORN repeat protein [Beggiatoa sp. PS]